MKKSLVLLSALLMLLLGAIPVYATTTEATVTGTTDDLTDAPEATLTVDVADLSWELKLPVGKASESTDNTMASEQPAFWNYETPGDETSALVFNAELAKAPNEIDWVCEDVSDLNDDYIVMNGGQASPRPAIGNRSELSIVGVTNPWNFASWDASGLKAHRMNEKIADDATPPVDWCHLVYNFRMGPALWTGLLVAIRDDASLSIKLTLPGADPAETDDDTVLTFNFTVDATAKTAWCTGSPPSYWGDDYNTPQNEACSTGSVDTIYADEWPDDDGLVNTLVEIINNSRGHSRQARMAQVDSKLRTLTKADGTLNTGHALVSKASGLWTNINGTTFANDYNEADWTYEEISLFLRLYRCVLDKEDDHTGHCPTGEITDVPDYSDWGTDAAKAREIVNLISKSNISRESRMAQVDTKLRALDSTNALVTAAATEWTTLNKTFSDGYTAADWTFDDISTFLGSYRCALDTENVSGHCND